MAEATKKVNVSKEVKEVAAKAEATVKKEATEAAKKATTAAKTTAKKATTTAKKATTTAKKATTTAKKTAKKTAAKAKKVTIQNSFIQWGGRSYNSDDVVSMCKDAFKAENKRKAIEEINVYVNVDENAAYYVVKSGETEFHGRVDL